MVRSAMTAMVPMAAALLASCAAAPSTQVTVADAWAQPIDASGRSVAAYMTITLRCPGADTLRAVAARPPAEASLHESRIVDNALRMTPLASIPIPCGKPFMLKPLAGHVMVMGLGEPVTIGTAIPLTLTFDNAGQVDVSVAVTTMAVLENVDPMNMHGGSHGGSHGGAHGGGHGNMAGMDMH